MAIYEYRCRKCMRIIVRSFPMHNFPKTIRCDKCGREAEKLISVSNFAIKGYSYKNGYSKEKK
jgi:putative FmdB family regulatory protein